VLPVHLSEKPNSVCSLYRSKGSNLSSSIWRIYPSSSLSWSSGRGLVWETLIGRGCQRGGRGR
jgi:hypothetical protein